jgi:hypothetical protein
MPSRLRSDRERDRTASKTFTRYFLIAIATAALVGLAIGVVWVVAGLLHFHPLW